MSDSPVEMHDGKPFVRTPERIIPLDELHYDLDEGLHYRANCDEVHGHRTPREAVAALDEHAATLATLQRYTADNHVPVLLEQLEGYELLEDMLAHLREMARRIRGRHHRHFAGEPLKAADRSSLLLEARAVRSLAHVLLQLYPEPTDAGADHRTRRSALPWKDGQR